MDARSVPGHRERTPQPSEAAGRPRAEPVEAIGSGSERPTPTVLGERRPFVSGTANPAAKRSRSVEAIVPRAKEKGRSRARAPDGCGGIIALRSNAFFAFAQTRKPANS